MILVLHLLDGAVAKINSATFYRDDYAERVSADGFGNMRHCWWVFRFSGQWEKATQELDKLLGQLVEVTISQVVVEVGIQGLRTELVGLMDALGTLAHTSLWTL